MARYLVEATECVISAVDGDQRTDSPNCDATMVYRGDSLDDARTARDEWARENPCKAGRTRHGCGSVTYHAVTIEELSEDEDGYECATLLDSETVDTLSDRMARAWRRAYRSYIECLDYREDDYDSVTSVLSWMDEEA